MFVQNSFINKRFITKSSDDESDLFSIKASVPYSNKSSYLRLVFVIYYDAVTFLVKNKDSHNLLVRVDRHT